MRLVLRQVRPVVRLKGLRRHHAFPTSAIPVVLLLQPHHLVRPVLRMLRLPIPHSGPGQPKVFHPLQGTAKECRYLRHGDARPDGSMQGAQ